MRGDALLGRPVKRVSCKSRVVQRPIKNEEKYISRKVDAETRDGRGKGGGWGSRKGKSSRSKRPRRLRETRRTRVRGDPLERTAREIEFLFFSPLSSR